MRIALLNPNTSQETTKAMVEIAADAAGPVATIKGFTAQVGAPLITEPHALSLASKAVASLSPALRDTDAVIVSAFGDPGLDALRDSLAVPVTGIAEAGMAEAAAWGRFAVVTTTPELAAQIAATAARHGHSGFMGTWATPGDPATVMRDPTALQVALDLAILQAVAEADVSAVVIGGGPLAAAARALVATSPVPLIEPIPAAVRLSFARLGLTCPA